MRRRSQRGLPLLVLALAIAPACGKRADPLAPYAKTPQPPSGIEVSQVGDEIEIRVTAPRTTTENRPLPVIELEWLEAPAEGDFRKQARPIFREEVAPGETRIKRFPLPSAPSRLSVRAYSGKARSNNAPLSSFTPALIPARPPSLEATATATGIQLHWTNPPGAEPWPSPTPLPTPTPRASPPAPAGAPTPPAGSVEPAAAITAPVSPALLDRPTSGMPPAEPPPDAPAPGGADPRASQPGPIAGVSSPGGPDQALSKTPTASPSTSPTPAPLALPSGIRIFRSDGAPRLAREPLQASSWLDTTLKPGEKPCYEIRYAASLKPLVESAPTEPVCVQFQDIIPPEPPDRLLGDIGTSFVELSWLPSPSTDVDFYRIYRTMETEERAMVIQTEGLLLRVRDLKMTPGPRTYEVVAVDTRGNESLPGPALRIVIP